MSRSCLWGSCPKEPFTAGEAWKGNGRRLAWARVHIEEDQNRETERDGHPKETETERNTGRVKEREREKERKKERESTSTKQKEREIHRGKHTHNKEKVKDRGEYREERMQREKKKRKRDKDKDRNEDGHRDRDRKGQRKGLHYDLHSSSVRPQSLLPLPSLPRSSSRFLNRFCVLTQDTEHPMDHCPMSWTVDSVQLPLAVLEKGSHRPAS
jgi:hypothetical protein